MRLFVTAALVKQALWFTSAATGKVALVNQAFWFTSEVICNSLTRKSFLPKLHSRSEPFSTLSFFRSVSRCSLLATFVPSWYVSELSFFFTNVFLVHTSSLILLILFFSSEAFRVALFLQRSCLLGMFLSSLSSSPMYFSFIHRHWYCCIAFIDIVALPS